jgi:hypothetical protein
LEPASAGGSGVPTINLTEPRRTIWVAETIKKAFGYQKTPIEDGSGMQKMRGGTAPKSPEKCHTGTYHGVIW